MTENYCIRLISTEPVTTVLLLIIYVFVDGTYYVVFLICELSVTRARSKIKWAQLIDY